MRRMILGLVVACTLASPSQADDWPSSGNFDVVEIDGGCAAGGEFVIPGRSDTGYIISFDGDQVVMALGSRDWSLPADGTEVSFSFSEAENYTGPASAWTFSDGKKGFRTRFEAAVLEPFARSEELFVFVGQNVVAHLNMRGSAAATATLRRCAAFVLRRDAAQARREQAFDYIAEDPFASTGGGAAPPGVVRSPVITNPSWASQPRPTYPDPALERGLSGSADLMCTVNPNGSVTGCSVVSETPPDVGFGRAALAAAQSARLSPRSVDGVAPGGSVRFTLRFNLPD